MSRRITDLKGFFKGSSFLENALMYYISKAVSGFQYIEVKARDRKIAGVEFDIIVIVNKTFILLYEYDGCGWHQDLQKDLNKNRIANDLNYPLLRIREKGCPIMMDSSINIIQRDSKKNDSLDISLKNSLEWLVNILKVNNVLPENELYKLELAVKDMKKLVDTRIDKENIIELISNEIYKQENKGLEELKAELLVLAKKNLEYFFNSNVWDEYVELNKLFYKTHYYVYYFDSWAGVVEEAWGKSFLEVRKYKAIQQGLETIEHVTSFKYYKDYIQELNRKDYLGGTAIINLFGSWNIFKEALGLKQDEYIREYTEEYLIENAKKHKDLFKNTSKYDEFAKENSLPRQHAYIRRFGSMDAAKAKIGINEKERNTKNNWSNEELIKIACNYKQHFTSVKNWKLFRRKMIDAAGEQNIPSPKVYQDRFGWSKIKAVVAKNKDSDLNNILKDITRHFK